MAKLKSASRLTVDEIKFIIDNKVRGRIEPAHDDAGHHYRFVGTDRIIDSVTTIIGRCVNKPHLGPWMIKKAIAWLEVDDRWLRLKEESQREDYIRGAIAAPAEIRDDAGDVGHLAHAVIEKYLNEWMDTGRCRTDIRSLFAEGADTRAIACARGAEALMAKHKLVPLASEILVGNPKVSAGTLDHLCLWDGKLTLADWKSSNQVGDDYAMQVAAYRYFFQQMTGLKIEQIKIIHLSKDMDKFAVYDVVEPAKAYAAFKHLVAFDNYWSANTAKLRKDVKRAVL